MGSEKLVRLFIVLTVMLWAFPVLSNLSGVAKVTFLPKSEFVSILYGNMLVTAATSGSINYRISEKFLGETKPPEFWQKRFAVKLSQRDDGGYDIYRLLTPEGEQDGETLLSGSFYRNEEDNTAILEYRDIEDDSWVRMEFSNTRNTPPKTEAEKESWRLKVKTTIRRHPSQGQVLFMIEDELSWFDIVAGGVTYIPPIPPRP